MKIGQMIDNLGVDPTMDDGELVESAVVLLKVLHVDGRTSMRCCWSEGQSWLERHAMLDIASSSERYENVRGVHDPDDD